MPFPIELKNIENAEQQLAFKFPDSYKEKMLKENGGEVPVGNDLFSLYPIYDTSSKKRLKRTFNSVTRETEISQKFGLPEDFIAIADNGCGDLLIFIKCKEKYDSTIYFWNHENDEIIRVAEDFSELIE